MIKKLIKSIPRLYDYYLHIQRVRAIKEICRIKSVDSSSYPLILADIYEKKIGHKLNWNNLRSYTEKMQWAKLYDADPMKTELSDKYKVRKWVSKKIGEEYLIPLLGKWDSYDEIDFDSLPNQFVLKTNHGSGTNIIVRDKQKMDHKVIKRTIEDWLNTDYGFTNGFELHYSKIKPLIIAEQYIENSDGQLQDYKFICFDGKPYYCWVDKDRYSKHTRTVCNLNWDIQPWNQASYEKSEDYIECPINFDKMVELVEILCEGFSHVRVDLYNVFGTIYFGEMTFTNGSGLDPIVPEEYDFMLGNMWNIPSNK